MAEVRLRRLESLLREEICSMILKREIKDPRIEELTTVTEVKLSKDLGHAKVWVSRFGDRAALQNSVDALNHAAGYIQSVLARRVPMPEVTSRQVCPDNSKHLARHDPNLIRFHPWI